MGLLASALSLHDTSPSRSQSDSFNTSPPCPSTAQSLPSASHVPQSTSGRPWKARQDMDPVTVLSSPRIHLPHSLCSSHRVSLPVLQPLHPPATGLGTALTPLPERSPNGPLSRLLQVFAQMALSPEDAAWPTHLNFNPLPFLNSRTP